MAADRQALAASAACVAPAVCLGASVMPLPGWLAAVGFVAGACGCFAGWHIAQITRRQTRDLEGQIAAEAARVEHAQALIDNLVDGVLTTDTHGVIEWSNPAALSMFGYEAPDLAGQPCSLLLAEGDRHRSPLAAMCAAGELLGRRRDGSTFPLDVAVGTLQLVDRPLLILVLRDATARRQAEAQRAQAQKLESMGVLVAGIAHEIGTPLQYVSNQVDFLGQGFSAMLEQLSPEPVLAVAATTSPALVVDEEGGAEDDLAFLRRRIPSALQHVRQGLDQVVRIVAGLRHFSHPGHTPRSQVDLNRVVSDAIEITRNSWKQVGGLQANLVANPAQLHGHGGELMQVFVNLLVNAVDAISERQQLRGGGRGSITVRTGNRDDSIVVEVTDDGCGIDEAARARVFDLFFTTKPAGKGTGQGLAVAHQVVRKHGGQIAFTPAEGGGTRFVVQLPLMPASLTEGRA